MALAYALMIELDAASLAGMKATRSRLVLAKQGTTGRPNVAWLACEPSAETTITWSETYGVYAASPGLATGRALHVTAEIYPATDRSVYSFRGAGFDRAVFEDGVLPLHYDVRNESGMAATFGLCQAATVNGVTIRGPVNAAVVPAYFVADFAPPTILRMWVVPRGFGGRIVTVPQDASALPYGDGVLRMRWRYSAGAQSFMIVDNKNGESLS
jgi:hypothetical protein